MAPKENLPIIEKFKNKMADKTFQEINALIDKYKFDPLTIIKILDIKFGEGWWLSLSKTAQAMEFVFGINDKQN